MAEHSFLRALTRFALVLIGILIVLFGGVWIASQVPAIQRDLADRLSEAAGPNLGFGRIAPIFWPGLGVSVDGLYLDANPEDPTHHVVRVDSTVIVLSFSELLQGEISVQSLSLENADVLLERDADGSFPLEALIDQVTFRDSEPEGETEPSSKSASSDFGVIPEVTIEDSTIRFVDHSAKGSKAEIELVDIELHLGASRPGVETAVHVAVGLKEGGQFSGEGTLSRSTEHREIEDVSFELEVAGTGIPLRATLFYLLPGDVLPERGSSVAVTAQVSGDLGGSVEGYGVVKFSADDQLKWLGVEWVGPLRFETGFVVGGSQLSLTDSVLEANGIRWEKLRSENFITHFDLESSAIRFKDARLGFYGGTIAFSGLVDFRQGTQVDLETTVTGVDMQSLMEASTGEAPEVGFDTLEGEFEVAGSIGSGDRWFDGLSGDGSVLLQGGNLPSSSVIGSVGGALANLIPGFARPDISSMSAETVIDYWFQSMKLQTGVVEISNLEFVTQDYTMSGTGTIGLDGAVSLNTELDLTLEGMQKLFLSMALPIPTGGVQLLPSLPFHVTGTVAHPFFIPDVTSIPRIALRTIFSPILGVGRFIGGLFSGQEAETDPSEEGAAPDPQPAGEPAQPGPGSEVKPRTR